MIEFVEGDIFEVEGDIICHQTNCQGYFNAGFAKKIREKYPNVYKEYKQICDNQKTFPDELLGVCHIVDVNGGKHKYVANLFGQYDICPRNKIHTDYNALEFALENLYYYAKDSCLNTVLVPDMIGCGLAGGDRNVVLEIIKKIFENDSKITVKIVKYV